MNSIISELVSKADRHETTGKPMTPQDRLEGLMDIHMCKDMLAITKVKVFVLNDDIKGTFLEKNIGDISIKKK